ncbi:MAG TPA: dihydrofolate reductase [Candidatus Limnocylindrales bacterium]|nr:dihydrofolate reductase [Candidatus Limnocylindrales bacterium]
MKYFQAIAAMSLNRAIGADGKIPWHLPEDFKWFKQQTIGKVILMGRKTFEGLGKALPNRKNIILTRHPRKLITTHPEIFGQYHEWRGGKRVGSFLKKLRQSEFYFTKSDRGKQTDILLARYSPGKFDPESFSTEIFICGGAEIYVQLLPHCSDLYLTLVKRKIENGDAFFPPFEDKFELVEEIRDEPEFKILHYRHKSLMP